MFSKSLVIFAAIGVLAGLGYGIYLIDFKATDQVVYVEGPSLSIVTEKSDYKRGETIHIRIVNSGTVPITFSDSSFNLEITGLSGILMYEPLLVVDEAQKLIPGGETSFYWNQIKNDGDAALEGLYKISVHGGAGEPGEHGSTLVEKSVIVTIWK